MALIIVHKETMNFVGIHYTKLISKKDFPKFIRKFNNRKEEISNVVNGERIYCRLFKYFLQIFEMMKI